MNHGLKSLAQELPKYGRMGDTMVAHINPQEAALLKSLGGSGTINPHTGLPEFGMFGIGGGGGFLGTGINKNASDPVSNALSNNPVSKAVSNAVQSGAGAVDQALVGLDKTVGKAIPGGWGTVASVAGSMVGLPTPLMVGLGALNGSGVMRKGGSFNLQGAIMGGAMAYGMSELGDYMRSAVPGAEVAGVTPPPTVDAAGNLVNPATGEIGSGLAGNASGVVAPAPVPSGPAYGDFAGSLSDPTAGMAQAYTPPPPPSITSNLMSGNIGDAMTQIGDKVSSGIGSLGTSISEGATNLGNKAVSLYDTATNPDTYTSALTKAGENVSDTGAGLKNLVGAGDITAKEAAKLAATSGVSPAMAGAATLYGTTGLMALDEQRKYLDQQKAANAISQAEYDSAVAEINRSEEIARRTVAEHPFSTNPDTSATIGDTSYARNREDENLYKRGVGTLYAMGGPIDGEAGGDDNFSMGGIPGYAAGGMPRFLSGGGDGMSDSIPANIEGKQEARLADGEFVIPADVVSHLGNGSSKAGAKQLYSMMNKVRKARTGNPKQGKQINPRKYLPA